MLITNSQINKYFSSWKASPRFTKIYVGISKPFKFEDEYRTPSSSIQSGFFVEIALVHFCFPGPALSLRPPDLKAIENLSLTPASISQ